MTSHVATWESNYWTWLHLDLLHNIESHICLHLCSWEANCVQTLYLFLYCVSSLLAMSVRAFQSTDTSSLFDQFWTLFLILSKYVCSHKMSTKPCICLCCLADKEQLGRWEDWTSFTRYCILWRVLVDSSLVCTVMTSYWSQPETYFCVLAWLCTNVRDVKGSDFKWTCNYINTSEWSWACALYPLS